MASSLIHLEPEASELERLRAELSRLEIEVLEREICLANLRGELSRFEGRYLREVGTLYAELDEWCARIADLIAEREGTAEAKSTASQARNMADASYEAAHGEAANSPDL